MIKQAYRQQVQIGETDLTELSIHEMRAEEATIRDELQFVKIRISWPITMNYYELLGITMNFLWM